jgi:hypothetical protein
MYALVNEEVVIEYPIHDLRSRFPNISFPSNAESHHFPPGVVKVEPSAIPVVNRNQYVREGAPIKTGSTWLQVWEIHNKEPDQIAAETAMKVRDVRNERDGFLRQTDWVVTRFIETGVAIPTLHTAYRAALRDIPTQPGFPWDVQWPDKP